MIADDVAQDKAYGFYLRARTKSAKASALTDLLLVSEPFIARATRHFARGSIREIDPEDALQQARIGFIDAVRRADPKRGPLRPYCLSRIRHELQTLAEVSFGIKIPRKACSDNDCACERPRIVTSFDAPADGSSLSELVASGLPSALDMLVTDAADRSHSDRHTRNVVRGALNKPAIPQPRPRTAPMSEKTPLDALAIAIDGMKVYMQELDAQEHAIRAKRDEASATLRKAAEVLPPAPASTASVRAGGGALPAQPATVLALNQGKLPHRIIACLRAHPGMSGQAIADECEEPVRLVYAELRHLRDTKLVVMQGQARYTTYSLAPKP